MTEEYDGVIKQSRIFSLYVTDALIRSSGTEVSESQTGSAVIDI